MTMSAGTVGEADVLGDVEQTVDLGGGLVSLPGVDGIGPGVAESFACQQGA